MYVHVCVHDIVENLYFLSSLCRVLTSIKGAPEDYGMESGKLKPFEKLLQTLEGKLMEGKLFMVHILEWQNAYLYVCATQYIDRCLMCTFTCIPSQPRSQAHSAS